MRASSVLTAVLTAAVGVGACSVQTEERAQVQDDAGVPFGLLEEDAPPFLPPVSGTDEERVSLCFVGDGVLAIVESALEPPVDLSDVVIALAEPPDAESLRTALGDPQLVADVELNAGVARVDLLPAITTLGGEDQLLAVAQLVCTLTERPGIGLVTFTLEGAPIDVPTGDGSLTSEPVSRDDYTDLLT
jgi:hypothetical protein